MPSARAGAAPGARARILLVLIGVAAVACVIQPLIELPLQIGRNHNEGWNAFHAASHVEGRDLYPPADALVSNNYPPLSYVVVGALAGPSGDALITGRAVAFAAMLVVLACIAWIGREATSSAWLGAYAAFLVMGTLGAHYQNYVALNDPQMLGHALQFLGLVLLLSRGERRWAVVFAVVLLVAGGFAKHNLLAVPAGVLVWLFAERRPHRGLWAVVAAAATLAGLAACAVVLGPDFLASILAHPRDYDLFYAMRGLSNWFVPIAPVLVGAAVVLLFPARDRKVRLTLCIGWAALGFGLLSALGDGMNYNALFDLVFVAGILCAVAIGELSSRAGQAGPSRVAVAAMIAFASSFLLASPMRAYRAKEMFDARDHLRQVASGDLDFVRDRHGPVLCEDPAVAFWAGKSFDVDLFNVSQKVAAGALDESVIADRIAGGEFGVVQVVYRDRSEFLTEATNEVFREHYRLARRSEVNGFFYVPRGEGGSPTSGTGSSGSRGTDQ